MDSAAVVKLLGGIGLFLLGIHHLTEGLKGLSGDSLRRTLQRVRSVTEDFHLVLHTSPSTLHPSKNLGYWKTIDDDYHWHIEILPILGPKAKSYTFKEVYASPVSPESAAARLRERPTEP